MTITMVLDRRSLKSGGIIYKKAVSFMMRITLSMILPRKKMTALLLSILRTKGTK